MLLPRGWWRRAEAARGEGRLRGHLPGNGDRSTLPLLFIFQATKAPVKCVSSLTLARSPGSSSGSDQLPVPGGSRDCASCLGPNKCQGPEAPGSPGFGGGLALGRGRKSGQRGASGLRPPLWVRPSLPIVLVSGPVGQGPGVRGQK